jgi:serine/threonine protein phosphatase PrpC
MHETKASSFIRGRHSTFRNGVTAALGASSQQADPRVLRFRLFHNDQLLLCTDGLTEMVAGQTIAPKALAGC